MRPFPSFSPTSVVEMRLHVMAHSCGIASEITAHWACRFLWFESRLAGWLTQRPISDPPSRGVTSVPLLSVLLRRPDVGVKPHGLRRRRRHLVPAPPPRAPVSLPCTMHCPCQHIFHSEASEIIGLTFHRPRGSTPHHALYTANPPVCQPHLNAPRVIASRQQL